MYVKKEKKRKSPQRKFRDRNKLRRGERCQTQSSGEVEGESHLSSWKSWKREGLRCAKPGLPLASSFQGGENSSWAWVVFMARLRHDG